MRQYWMAGAGFLTLAACCGAMGLSLGPGILSPAEVRPPFPESQLLAAHSGWTPSGRHAIRVYRASGDIRAVIDWYRAEGGGASARVPPSLATRCSRNRLTVPRLDLPFSRLWALSRTTDAIYCPKGDHVRVTTDTYYRWEVFEP